MWTRGSELGQPFVSFHLRMGKSGVENMEHIELEIFPDLLKLYPNAVGDLTVIGISIMGPGEDGEEKQYLFDGAKYRMPGPFNHNYKQWVADGRPKIPF